MYSTGFKFGRSLQFRSDHVVSQEYRKFHLSNPSYHSSLSYLASCSMPSFCPCESTCRHSKNGNWGCHAEPCCTMEQPSAEAAVHARQRHPSEKQPEAERRGEQQPNFGLCAAQSHRNGHWGVHRKRTGLRSSLQLAKRGKK